MEQVHYFGKLVICPFGAKAVQTNKCARLAEKPDAKQDLFLKFGLQFRVLYWCLWFFLGEVFTSLLTVDRGIIKTLCLVKQHNHFIKREVGG